jgi:methionyl aminopeptidase
MAAPEIKTAEELALMREAGRIVHDILQTLAKSVAPGVTTFELDRIAEDLTYRSGSRPAFKGYRQYPCSLCVSINEEVVHGIPSRKRKLNAGDIVGLDFGVIFRGFHGDAAMTVPVGTPSDDAARLMRVTRESLMKAIEQIRPGNRISDISRAVQVHAESNGYSVVRDFVGHGIGRALHEEPQIPNYVGSGLPDPRLRAGMVVAVEPMVNQGKAEVIVLDDKWTAVTVDHKLSAHFEHTIAVTEQGPEILTAAA